MSTVKIPPPPDAAAALDLWKYRAHAAEMACYAMETQIRETVLPYMQAIVEKIHALNEKFPIGDGSAEGQRTLMLKAVRFSMPEYAEKSDEELLTLFTGGSNGKR